MGLSFQDIMDGNQAALQKLAFRCRADHDRLTMASITKIAPKRYTFRGQELVHGSLSRATMRVCPHCLMADLERGREIAQLRPYGRAIWLIDPIRTCFQHNTCLVPAAKEHNGHRSLDFSQMVQPCLPNLADIGKQSLVQHPSRLEQYLVDRLAAKANAASWLAELPFYAAATVCEVLGATETRGIRFQTRTFEESDWHDVGAAGFEIANSGEQGIRSLLTRLQVRFPFSKKAWGPQAFFGRMYQWLAYGTDDAAYDPLRNILRDHLIETMPVGPGDELFGEPVKNRQLHSVRSAVLEFGIHSKRLRKLVHTAGYIRTEALSLSDDRILFDARKAHDLLTRVGSAMSLNDARRHINAPRQLFTAGLIKYFIPGGTDIVSKRAFAKQDLDDFMDRLLAKAFDADPDDRSLCTIPVATQRANCSATEIVHLIFDGTIARVGRHPTEHGFLSVLVDSEEVKRHVRGPELQGMKLKDVENKLRVRSNTVKALLDNNHLPCGVALNPAKRYPQRYVKEADLKEFMDRVVCIDMLVRERRTRRKNLRALLDSLGIAPEFVLAEFDLAFYDRRTISKHFSDA
jgi:hypothetical protein